jgi:polyphosphate kinase
VKSEQNLYIDRDLSWLDFNTRVLELAENQKLPLLERIKFLAIFSSNLDEFFMVRVASIKRKVEYGNKDLLISGLTPRELLTEIHHKVRLLQERVSYLVENDLKIRLDSEGIRRVSWDSLSDEERAPLTKKFTNDFSCPHPFGIRSCPPFPAYLWTFPQSRNHRSKLRW